MSRQMKDSGIEWIGEIPETWNTDRLQWHLKEVKESNSPIRTENILSLTIESGVIPYEDKGNQGNKAKENYEEYKLAFPDTLVVNSMNVIIGAVGISKYFGCVSPVYYVFNADGNTDLRYIYYLFTNVGFQKEMRKYAKGILEIRLRIAASDMLRLQIPNPKKEEQKRIADYLDQQCAHIDAVIEKTKASIEEYKKLKQAVITQAVTKGVRGDRPMKDSELEWAGNIPQEWKISKISRIASTFSGATPLRSKESDFFENADIRWVRTLDLNDWLVEDSSEKITEDALNNASCSIMPVNTVCVAMYGGAGTIGKCGLLTKECTTNQAVCSIICDDKMLLPQFMLYELLALKKYWMLFAVGTRKDPNISQEIVGKMKVIIPSIDEQQEIIKYLNQKVAEVDELVRRKENFLKSLIEYKKSLIYEYITGKREVEYD